MEEDLSPKKKKGLICFHDDKVGVIEKFHIWYVKDTACSTLSFYIPREFDDKFQHTMWCLKGSFRWLIPVYTESMPSFNLL